MKIEGEKTIIVTLSVDTNATHKFKTVHKLKFQKKREIGSDLFIKSKSCKHKKTSVHHSFMIKVIF